jgi:hypothetical protein
VMEDEHVVCVCTLNTATSSPSQYNLQPSKKSIGRAAAAADVEYTTGSI